LQTRWPGIKTLLLNGNSLHTYRHAITCNDNVDVVINKALTIRSKTNTPPSYLVATRTPPTCSFDPKMSSLIRILSPFTGCR